MSAKTVIGTQTQFQPTPNNGVKGETSNVIHVDDNWDDVIIIDVPHFLGDSKSIVCIDDDDDDDLHFEDSAGKLKEQWEKAFSKRQFQAKEAQRLLQLQKKQDAQNTRLIHIETRQKQRIQQVRETQKQDEDNLNLKEQLRAEIKNHLFRLESTCPDTASLLRGLGIQLNGGPNEVRVALKRALLSFHPDRAPQSDIRQQVEAEEKFKLINRLREKFLSSS